MLIIASLLLKKILSTRVSRSLSYLSQHLSKWFWVTVILCIEWRKSSLSASLDHFQHWNPFALRISYLCLVPSAPLVPCHIDGNEHPTIPRCFSTSSRAQGLTDSKARGMAADCMRWTCGCGNFSLESRQRMASFSHCSWNRTTSSFLCHSKKIPAAKN